MKYVSAIVSYVCLVAPIYTNAFALSAPNTLTQRTSTAIFESDSGDTVLYSDADADQDDSDETTKKIYSKNKRWASLNPNVKARIIEEGQKRAVRNKKKREPAADKKRRMMMHYKTLQTKSKRSSRVQRPYATNSPDRVPLAEMELQKQYNGTVISLTDFGAYVDIGTECDGLLHVSQMTRERFVEHPRQVLSPGDLVDVTLIQTSVDLKKMHLSLLPQEIRDNENEDEEEFDERIDLEDLAPNDELWGEIRRVTSYGAYVELGAVVDGWLHFMDHPEFEFGTSPGEMMRVGDRIRCWVANIDEEKERIKLTSNRPKDLPGPRREVKKMVNDENYY